MMLEDSIKKCFEYCYSGEIIQPEESVFSKYFESIPKDFVYQYPLNVIWKLTSSCNLRCKHCFYYTDKSAFDTKNDMTKEEALSLAEYLVNEINIISVLFTGGEALTSPYFFDLLEYFKSKNVCINLLTNGTLITEEIADKLSNILNPKYDNIQISLDGANEKTHDSIRGNGNFEKAVSAIDRLNSRGLGVTIACTLTSENIDSFSEFSKFFENYNIKELRLGGYKVFSEEQSYLSPNLDDLFTNIAKLIDKKIPISRNFFNAYDFLKYPIGKNLFKTLPLPKDSICNKLCHNHNRVFISADAKLYLCTSAETAGLCIGDLREESFEQIWAKRYNNPLFKPRVDFICQKCQYKHWCNAGCAVMSYLNNKDACTAPKECLHQYELEKTNA